MRIAIEREMSEEAVTRESSPSPGGGQSIQQAVERKKPVLGLVRCGGDSEPQRSSDRRQTATAKAS